jgi:hypothetical protein
MDWNVEPGTMLSPTDPDFESGVDPALSAAAGFIHTGSGNLICGSRNCVPSRCDLATNTCYDDGEDCNVDQDCSRCHTYGWQCVTNEDCSSAGKMAIVNDKVMYCDEDGVVRTVAKAGAVATYNTPLSMWEIIGNDSFGVWQDMIIDINESSQRGQLRLVPKNSSGGTDSASVQVTCPTTTDTAAINLSVCDPDATVRSCLYTDATGYGSNDGFCMDYYGEVLGGLITVYETAPLTFTTDAKLSANSMVLEADGDLTLPGTLSPLTLTSATTANSVTDNRVSIDTNGAGDDGTRQVTIGDGTDALPLRTCWTQGFYNDAGFFPHSTKYCSIGFRDQGLPNAQCTPTSSYQVYIPTVFPMDVEWVATTFVTDVEMATSEVVTISLLTDDVTSDCEPASNGGATVCAYDQTVGSCTMTGTSATTEFTTTCVGSTSIPAGRPIIGQYAGSGHTGSVRVNALFTFCAEAPW